MNNRTQKNAIYANHPKNVLPYRKVEDVTTKAEGFRSNTINGIFKQLVDNDRFIESSIYRRSSEMDGPRRYGQEQVASLPDGSKILGSQTASEQLQIFRKVERPLGESVQSLRNEKVNCLRGFGRTLLVGTDRGLYETQDGTMYQQVLDPDELEDEVLCIHVYGQAAFVGMGENLFSVIQHEHGNTLLRINRSEFGGAVRDVLYLPAQKKLYVASESGLYSAEVQQYRDIPEESLQFQKVGELDRAGALANFRNYSLATIVDQSTASDRDVVIGTSEGILSQIEFEGLVDSVKLLDGKNCHFADRISSATVFGTDYGVLDSFGNTLISTETPVMAFCRVGDDRFYLVDQSMVSARYIENEYGELSVEQQSFPLDSLLCADYAMGMFTVPLSDDGGRRREMAVAYTASGAMVSFLPQLSTVRQVVDGGVQCAGLGFQNSLYYFDGTAVNVIDMSDLHLEDSNDVVGVDIPDFGISSALKTIPVYGRQDTAVVLAQDSIWRVLGGGQAVQLRSLSGTGGQYTDMAWLGRPLQYLYYPLSSEGMSEEEWEQIQDDAPLYMTFDVAASRTGSDGYMYIDLVAGPWHGSTPTGVVQISIKTQGTFQYPINIRQDGDDLVVLGMDGLYHASNQDIEAELNNMDTSAVVWQTSATVSVQMDRTYLSASGINQLASTDDSMFVLSSGNLMQADVQPTFIVRGLDSTVSSCSPITPVSSMLVISHGTDSDSILRLKFNSSGNYDQTDCVTSAPGSIYGFATGPSQSPSAVMYCGLGGVWRISCSMNGYLVDSVLDIGETEPCLDYVDDWYVESTVEDDYENEWVSCAVGYRMFTTGEHLSCRFLSARYLDDSMQGTSCAVSSFQFDWASVPASNVDVTCDLAVPGVSRLDSFQEPDTDGLPVGFVRTGNDISAVMFSIEDGQSVSVDMVKMPQTDGQYLELFQQFGAIVSSFNGRQIYQFGFDQDGRPAADRVGELVVNTQMGVVDQMDLDQFELDFDGSAVNMFKRLYRPGLDVDGLVYILSGGDALISLYGDTFQLRSEGFGGISQIIDDDGRIYLLSTRNYTQDDVESVAYDVMEYNGASQPSLCVEYAAQPRSFFRDGGAIYALSSGMLVKSTSNGRNYPIFDESQGAVNHVQTALGRLVLATTNGLELPIFSRVQQNGTPPRQMGIVVNMLSSVDSIAHVPSEPVRVVGQARGEDGAYGILWYSNEQLQFNRGELCGMRQFQMLAPSEGGGYLVSEDGAQASVLTDGVLSAYPFGGEVSTVNGYQTDGMTAYVATTDGMYSSRGFGVVDMFGVPSMQDEQISSYRRFIRVRDGHLLVPTNDGLYTVRRNQDYSIDVYRTTYSLSGRIGCIISSDGAYYASEGRRLLSASSDMQFQQFLDLSSEVNDLYRRNPREYYVGMDGGLARTAYMFDLSNDTHVFSEEELYDIFMEDFQRLKDELSSRIQAHCETDHAADSLVTRVNEELVSVDFGGTDLHTWSRRGFSETSSELTVENDVVYDMEFGSDANGDIQVQVSNFLTSDADARFSYIRRHWYSGLNELYIYIPTTNTYYISHVDGSPGCWVDHQHPFQRKNLLQFGEQKSLIASTIQDHATHISVLVPDTVALEMDQVMDVQINGNSLPLQIYRDDTFKYQEGAAADMFHSVVLPSEVVSVPMSADDKDENGNYLFRFACFGQDAQAVRIMYYDADSAVDENSFTVRYNGNGAMGQMVDQVFKLSEQAKPKRIRKCKFKWGVGDNKMFVGWSLSPSSNSVVLYEGDYLDLSALDIPTPRPGSVLTLYAVWVEYKESNGYTELVMDMGQENGNG